MADAALAIVLTALTYVAVHRNTRLREATIRYEHPKLHRLLRDYCSYSSEALASELAACGAAITRSAEDRVDATLATADADLELTTAISGGTLTGIAVDGKIGRLRCRIRKGSLIGIV